VDRDGDADEPLPLDLARGDRFLGTGPTVDMGAYEYLNTNGLGDPEPPAAGAPGPEPSGTAYIAFTYDALGRRIEKIVDSGGAQVEVTRYYYDGQNVVLETDADEAPRRSFVHGSQYIDERVLMRVPTGKEYYYLPRELHSVAALTDETGAIVEAATYDTYGKVAVYDGAAQAVEESPVGNPYYFTGRRLDQLPTASSPQPITKQLYHYRARAHDPGNGRFLQRDPAGQIAGANAYEFTRCNPMYYIDTDGRHPTPGGGPSVTPLQSSGKQPSGQAPVAPPSSPKPPAKKPVPPKDPCCAEKKKICTQTMLDVASNSPDIMDMIEEGRRRTDSKGRACLKSPKCSCSCNSKQSGFANPVTREAVICANTLSVTQLQDKNVIERILREEIAHQILMCGDASDWLWSVVGCMREEIRAKYLAGLCVTSSSCASQAWGSCRYHLSAGGVQVSDFVCPGGQHCAEVWPPDLEGLKPWKKR